MQSFSNVFVISTPLLDDPVCLTAANVPITLKSCSYLRLIKSMAGAIVQVIHIHELYNGKQAAILKKTLRRLLHQKIKGSKFSKFYRTKSCIIITHNQPFRVENICSNESTRQICQTTNLRIRICKSYFHGINWIIHNCLFLLVRKEISFISLRPYYLMQD